MNWLDIFCFTAVARTRSFSITARELMISQQAVSRHIRALEEELGFLLFLRNAQGVRLSRAGERMLRYFTQREEMLEGFKRRVRPREEDVLRVGWTQWLGCPPPMERAIDRFRTVCPGVTLLTMNLNHRELAKALDDGALDLLLTTRYEAASLAPFWQTAALWEEPIHLLAPARMDLQWERLDLYPHLADRAGEPDDAGVRARVAAAYEKLGVRPGRVDVFPEMGSVCLNLLLRDGVSLGTANPTVRANPDLTLYPTGQTATVTLALAPHEGRTAADTLARILTEEAVL